MFNKKLLLLVAVNFFVVLAFVVSYGKSESLVPLYIGLFPFVLCNYIYVREFVAPKPESSAQSVSKQPAKKTNFWALLIMPVMFCLYVPKMIQFDKSLGWSPLVSFGFSLLLCVVSISLYGGIKTALNSRK